MDVIEAGKGLVRVVAVHGIQGTRASWLPLVAKLDDVATFVLPNLRGRAGAVRGIAAEDYRLECFADDLDDAIREHVGEAPYFLAGWSMGVSVALAYLSREDALRPQGLILMSGTPMLDQTNWFVNWGAALIEEISEREERLGLVDAADRGAVARTWEAIRKTNQLHLLPGIDMPVLIVHGREDDDSPWPHATLMAEKLADCTLCPLDGVGHAIIKEATDDVANRIRDFIQSNATPGEK